MVRPLNSFQAPDVVVDVQGEISLKVVAPMGPPGPPGQPGPPGSAGAPGAAGKTILSGTIAPDASIGTPGDFYLNTATMFLHGPKSLDGVWPTVGSLVGPQGVTGEPGDSGKTILSGSGAPSNAVGTEGDFYLDTTSVVLYGPKGTNWPAGVSLVGPGGSNGTNGIDGKTILSGAGAPSNGTGSNGDFYVDTTATVLYGPKASGAWPAGVPLIGADGEDGADGANGADGRTILSGSGAPSNGSGSNGDFYFDTAATVLYGPKASGTWPSGVSLIGADGADGSDGTDGQDGDDGRTILNGTTAPGSGVGVAGDFYYNTATNTIYGPKDASTGWPSGVSLVGPAGAQGIQGIQGPAGASDVTYEGEWDDATTYAFKDQVAHDGALWIANTGNTDSEPSDVNSDWARATQQGEQGPEGSAGADGDDGANGLDGKTILSGTTAPGSGLGTNGDFYLNTATSQLYGPKASGAWPAPVSLVGPAGSAGAAGRTILNGTVAPTSGVGTDGDFYLNTATSTLYGPKASGNWPAGVSLVGAAGANGTNGTSGKTILSGTTAPSSGVGTDGDFYLNTATSTLYGPKAAGTWPSGVSLIGPAGANGTNGNTILYGTGAPSSGVGLDGNFYLDTASLTFYGPKASGNWPAGTSIVGPQGQPGIQGPEGPPGVGTGGATATTDQDTLLRGWTESGAFEMLTITYSPAYTNTVSSATVRWPDGGVGTLTTKAIDPTTQEVNAYIVTHEQWHKEVRQASVFRDSAGRVTSKPALTIGYLLVETWADMPTDFANWQEVSDTFPTWDAVLEGL